ncbi:energy transducer TonB [Erythrobacter sp.]|jgi:hypothetical protein|uniref:energy transducer TonB n=1 Tax=Erythrobacter sp. TaxID=1042 RepID=UPI002ECE2B7D|nr:energy transducer TonB [Erythrobacter sp.]
MPDAAEMEAQAMSPYRKELVLSGARAPIDKRALVLSVLLTAGLFVFLLGISIAKDAVRDESRALVLFSAHSIVASPRDRPAPQPADAAPVIADTPELSAPAARRSAVLPAPDLTIVPTPAIRLSPLTVPQIETLGVTPFPLDGRDGEGDRQTGAVGEAGAGGTLGGGSGPGGPGTGAGRKLRTDLTAQWAPQMDLDVLHRFYPDQAKLMNASGRAILMCMVLRNERVRDCSIVAEQPRGLDFGRAALRAAPTFRLRVFDQRGRRVHNEWVLVNIAASPRERRDTQNEG